MLSKAEKLSPETLTVVSNGPARQFSVRRPGGSFCPPETDWNDYYVEFSGYFGSYGPHLFAAAPELVAALKLAEPILGNGPVTLETIAAYKAVADAIARANGLPALSRTEGEQT